MPNSNRVKVLAGALVGAVILGLAVASVAAANGGRLGEVRAFAESIRTVLSTAGRTALSVDDITISTQTIALYQTAIERNGVPAAKAREQAIDRAIKDALTDREAARRGITVSDAAIDAFIASQRSSNANAPAENRAMFQATLQGLGMTEDQYWSDSRTRAAARAILINSKLVAALTPPGGRPADGAAELDRLLVQLKEKAVIHYAQ